ncbi:MAG: hypothetical protein F6J96_14410 [Symploca sp. SIO1C2]|nr:hypothetical protein [Symploca sp. SIO1C2]
MKNFSPPCTTIPLSASPCPRVQCVSFKSEGKEEKGYEMPLSVICPQRKFFWHNDPDSPLRLRKTSQVDSSSYVNSPVTVGGRMILGLAAAQRFAHLGIILGGIGSLQPNAASYIN